MATQILEFEVQLGRNILVNHVRDANPTGLSKALQASCDIDPVAVDIVAFDDHISQVDADAKLQPFAFFGCRLSLGNAVLPGEGASNSVHYTGKLHQEPIAHQLNDTSMMLVDQGF
jgi:hypothetical protein